MKQQQNAPSVLDKLFSKTEGVKPHLYYLPNLDEKVLENKRKQLDEIKK